MREVSTSLQFVRLFYFVLCGGDAGLPGTDEMLCTTLSRAAYMVPPWRISRAGEEAQ
jgi:hypothetical protein